MVEMRWLVKKVHVGTIVPGVNHVYSAKDDGMIGIRTLQMREGQWCGEPGELQEGPNGIKYRPLLNPQWFGSEWKDVPEVAE